MTETESEVTSEESEGIVFLRRDWVITIVMALVAAFILRTFVVQAYHVTSGSMVPTLEVSDRIVINKISYHVYDDPSFGEIVVFTLPDVTQQDDQVVKRVVGVGGDIIESKAGSLYINGLAIQQPFLQDGVVTEDFGPVEVPDGYVFLMGDNREESYDSRSYGPVPASTIQGKVVATWWPLSSLGGA